MSAIVPLLVIVPLLGAALALMCAGKRRMQGVITLGALITVAILGAITVVSAHLYGPLAVAVGGWEAPYGIVLLADRTSALLITVSALVLLAVLIFSIGQGIADGDEDTPVSIFYPSYLVLGAGVFDAFLANDLFNLYVAFEILLVASYVLLTMGGTEQRIRAGVTYIVVSLVSSVLFLAAIGVIYAACGTVSMAQLTARIAALDPQIQLILNFMLLIAFGIKAAIFPLSFWLPDSYPTAPAPVTAVFAGLLTKVGIYAILRTQTLVFSTSDINNVLLIIAAITLLVGILGALSQRDIKRILSFTLVSHIGYLLMGVALNSALGFGATVYYIVHHIVVQTAMFLVVGLIERFGGTTSLDRLGGLLGKSTLLGVLTFITMLNISGIPPFSGFIGKIGLFTAAAADGRPLHYFVIAIGTAVSLLTLYVLVRVWNIAFWRTPQPADSSGQKILENLVAAPNHAPRRVRETPNLMTGATIGMVAFSLLLTVFAGPLIAYAQKAGEVLQDPARTASWYFNNPETEEAP